MAYTDQKSCLTCAWRETCQKRFASTEDLGSRCPEYTFDVRLKKNIPADVSDKFKEPGSGLTHGYKK